MPLTSNTIPFCPTASNITSAGGTVVNNSDGTISVFTQTTSGGLAPVSLTKQCCEALGITGAYYDIDNQRCRWRANNGKCSLDTVFKLVLNPKGNDGSLFYSDDDEDCFLTIDFDYLFKLDCEALSSLIVPPVSPIVIGNPLPIIPTGPIGPTGPFDPGGLPVFPPGPIPTTPTTLRFAQQNQVACEELTNRLTLLNSEIENTYYSIVCETVSPQPINDIWVQDIRSSETTNNFDNTGFNCDLDTTETPNIRATNENDVLIVVGQSYCLTEPDGLNKWASILGSVRYQRFLQGDPTSYNCDDVQTMLNANEVNRVNNSPLYINECNTPFGYKSSLLSEKDEVTEQLTDCLNLQARLPNIGGTGTGDAGDGGLGGDGAVGGTGGILGSGGVVGSGGIFGSGVGVSSGLGGTVVTTGGGTTTGGVTGGVPLGGNITTGTVPSGGATTRPPVLIPPVSGICTSPLQALEALDISFTLDVVESSITGDTLTTVYEQLLFPRIGPGNLYDYLTNNSGYTGFYLCGDPTNGDAASFTSCSPLNFTGPISSNVYRCNVLKNLLENDLFLESGLPNTQAGHTTFNNNVGNDAFQSNWLHYTRIITDPTILNKIKNKKIKISLKVNDACVDFCVLMDSIVLDKSCTIVTRNDVKISKSPGFTLDRIRDNKKSWLNNDVYTNREFSITNSEEAKPIRLTEYKLNDERLVINTKEVDLDISLASAIETDVWCYLNDNECALTGSSIPCDCDPQIICCGDETVDYTKLMTEPLSGITVVEDFEYFMTSELIDAKDRKTLSAYPTLRGVYDRYLDNNGRCSNVSAGFNYEKIERFANLVGDYWVDLVEQVIPATTIWGSTKIYSNTIFDGQKFKYKSHTLLLGGNNFSAHTLPSPTTACTTGVSATTTTINGANITQSSYNVVCVAQMNSGSEFIGTVDIVGNVTRPFNPSNPNNQTLNTP